MTSHNQQNVLKWRLPDLDDKMWLIRYVETVTFLVENPVLIKVTHFKNRYKLKTRLKRFPVHKRDLCVDSNIDIVDKITF